LQQLEEVLCEGSVRNCLTPQVSDRFVNSPIVNTWTVNEGSVTGRQREAKVAVVTALE
jgi:hypothetical protein